MAHGVPAADYNAFLVSARTRAAAYGVTLGWLVLRDGQIRAETDPDGLRDMIAQGHTRKLAARDLASAVVQRRSGLLTVSAGLVAARILGAVTLVTGAIGGVHAEGGRLDVSADLIELARCGIPVVSAGIKPIVDVEATLEHLETAGVPVLSLGAAYLPTLYCNDTPFPLDQMFSSPESAVAAIEQQRILMPRVGTLVVNPVPRAAALSYAEVSQWVALALEAARTQGIKGSGLTPFLVGKMNRESGGRLMQTNRAALAANIEAAVRLTAALTGAMRPSGA
ncbi:MAG: pseudouridine-5'-phosphate glycosidase [Rhodospirillaceae bacterium]|nr:pseudouridine-5'-phosphate glycosidase [Rhodospirillaceae bacterium]